MITAPSGQLSNTLWVASDTFLISKGHSSDAIKAAKEGDNVKQNRELMELIGKVDSSATLWVAGMVPAESASMMGPMGIVPPKTGYLSLKLGSGVAYAHEVAHLRCQVCLLLNPQRGRSESVRTQCREQRARLAPDKWLQCRRTSRLFPGEAYPAGAGGWLDSICASISSILETRGNQPSGTSSRSWRSRESRARKRISRSIVP